MTRRNANVSDVNLLEGAMPGLKINKKKNHFPVSLTAIPIVPEIATFCAWLPSLLQPLRSMSEILATLQAEGRCSPVHWGHGLKMNYFGSIQPPPQSVKVHHPRSHPFFVGTRSSKGTQQGYGQSWLQLNCPCLAPASCRQLYWKTNHSPSFSPAL